MTEIRIKYFDTVAVAAGLCVLRTGFLFCASEFGNQLVSLSSHLPPLFRVSFLSHLPPFPFISLSSPPSYLYQIAHLGDDDEEPEFSSAMPLEEGETFFFAPRPLKNLVLVDELESLSPIMSAHVSVIAEVLVVHYEVYLN